MILMKPSDRLPLVIIGHGKAYKKNVMEQAVRGNITHLLHWLDRPVFRDFPAIYKGAQMMIYPSFHEGFGLPVLEAMKVGIPVITSDRSSLKEAGGDAARLIDPENPEALASAMLRIQESTDVQQEMIRKGYAHASGLTSVNQAEAYRSLYKELV
jgi:glycosyltransferase involved in cell wall biosynthesis